MTPAPETLGSGRFVVRAPLDGIDLAGLSAWHAYDTEAARPVAVIATAHGAPRSLEERFVAAARALSGLRAPHVMPVIDVGRVEGERGPAYVVTEPFEPRATVASLGPSLRGDAAALVRLFAQAAEGIAAIHRMRVLHRSIAPAALLVEEVSTGGRRTWSVRVSLPALMRESACRPTADEAARDFAAPEEWSLGFVDVRADVYALGASLYATLTGQAPRDRAAMLAWLAMPPDGRRLPRPPSLTERCPTLPRALVAVVERCLEERPDKRFRSMAELRDALAEVLRVAYAQDRDPAAAPDAESVRERAKRALHALADALFVGEGVLETERRFLERRAAALGVREADAGKLVAEVIADLGCRIVRSRASPLARRRREAPAVPPSWVDSGKSAYDLGIYQLMKDVHDVLEEAGVAYYAIGGTLLGAVRHGGFIPWDDDLDLAIADDDHARFEQAIPALRALGYTVYFFEGWDGWKIERHFDLPEVFGRSPAMFCDVFRSRTGDDGQLRYTSAYWNYPVPREVVFPRTLVRFGTSAIWCPASPQRYLDIELGEGWRGEAIKYNHLFPELREAGSHPTPPEGWLPAGPFGPLAERSSRR
jgi:hypothetical protein